MNLIIQSPGLGNIPVTIDELTENHEALLKVIFEKIANPDSPHPSTYLTWEDVPASSSNFILTVHQEGKPEEPRA